MRVVVQSGTVFRGGALCVRTCVSCAGVVWCGGVVRWCWCVYTTTPREGWLDLLCAFGPVGISRDGFLVYERKIRKEGSSGLCFESIEMEGS